MYHREYDQLQLEAIHFGVSQSESEKCRCTMSALLKCSELFGRLTVELNATSLLLGKLRQLSKFSSIRPIQLNTTIQSK